LSPENVRAIRERVAAGEPIAALASAFGVCQATVYGVVVSGVGFARGERHGSSKLTAEQVREIRRAHADGVQQHQLAQRFGVVQATVYSIVSRRRWTHIPEDAA
jgi:hypothetical protein